MRLILMNSTVMPCEGTYRAKRITEQEAKDVALTLFPFPVESYIGYPETADYVAKVLGIGVPVNRGQAELKNGDVVLVCKLKYRVRDPSQKGKLQPEEKDYEWWVVHYSDKQEGVRV